MDVAPPWHPFRHPGLCGLRGSLCVLSVISVFIVTIISLQYHSINVYNATSTEHADASETWTTHTVYPYTHTPHTHTSKIYPGYSEPYHSSGKVYSNTGKLHLLTSELYRSAANIHNNAGGSVTEHHKRVRRAVIDPEYSLVRQTWNPTDGVECERFCPINSQVTCRGRPELLTQEYYVRHAWTIIKGARKYHHTRSCIYFPGISNCTQTPNCIRPDTVPKPTQTQKKRCAMALLMLYHVNHTTSSREYYISYQNTDTRVIITDTTGKFQASGTPTNTSCRRHGLLTVGVKCDSLMCYERVHLNHSTRVVVHKWEAQELFQLLQSNDLLPYNDQHAANEVVTVYATQNMLYQYLQYTAQTNADNDCIACYTQKGIPTIIPLGGLADCKNAPSHCPLHCLFLNMQVHFTPHDSTNCTKLSKPITPPPPVIQDHGLIHPYCFCKGAKPTHTNVANRCEVKLDVSGRDMINNTLTVHVNLTAGTIPVADIFWLCADGKHLLQSLTKNWTGCCAPITLTGNVALLPMDTTVHRVRRDVASTWLSGKDKVLEQPTLTYSGVPTNIPVEHLVMSYQSIDNWVGFFPWFQNYKNAHWINYIWYNQQRFMNYTIDALESLGQQLDATSRMVLQNRFALDTMRAPDDGVCVLFGDDCCTYIPMNTAADGNFTHIMAKLRDLRDEHVLNTQGHSSEGGWFEWLTSGRWKAVLLRMGMILVIFLLILSVLTCCVIPFIRDMVIKLFSTFTGVVDLPLDDPSAAPLVCMVQPTPHVEDYALTGGCASNLSLWSATGLTKWRKVTKC